MTGIFFSVLDADMPRLCSCTPGRATVVSSIMPITTAEREWYQSQENPMALIDLFGEKNVSPHFDPHRPSLI